MNDKPLVYTVKKHDVFWKVALKFGLSVSDLRHANPDVKDNLKLVEGQTLLIPKR